MCIIAREMCRSRAQLPVEGVARVSWQPWQPYPPGPLTNRWDFLSESETAKGCQLLAVSALLAASEVRRCARGACEQRIPFGTR
jgi:hypothetical protein